MNADTRKSSPKLVMQQSKPNTESELEEDIPEMKHFFTEHLHSEFGTNSDKRAQDHQATLGQDLFLPLQVMSGYKEGTTRQFLNTIPFCLFQRSNRNSILNSKALSRNQPHIACTSKCNGVALLLRPCQTVRRRQILWAKRETETRIPKEKIT